MTISFALRATATALILFLTTNNGWFCHGFAAIVISGRNSERTATTATKGRTKLFYGNEKDSSAQDALERTAAHLEKLQRQYPNQHRQSLQHQQQQQLLKLTIQQKEHQEQQQQEEIENEHGGTTAAATTTIYVDADELDQIKRNYLLRSATSLKDELKARKLPRNGRKPDLALRLARDDVLRQHHHDAHHQAEDPAWPGAKEFEDDDDDDQVSVNEDTVRPLHRFAGLAPLSLAAGQALAKAGFVQPTPIQAAAIPHLISRQSAILHAETGSGKSLAFLLPITEHIWKTAASQPQQSSSSSPLLQQSPQLKQQQQQQSPKRALILTPTRELAAQVAGIATVLAPPGAVRLVARPTNLASDGMKDRGESSYGEEAAAAPESLAGRGDAPAQPPIIFVGSAKAILQSLYGDKEEGGNMPASPTPKPAAMEFLQSISWLVLDEVDRLLNIAKSRSDKLSKKRKTSKRHEKPAAVLSAAIERLTLGQVQVIAASATVGRPLRRELSRVLGLEPQQCPPVLRGRDEEDDGATAQPQPQRNKDMRQSKQRQQQQQLRRAVTIPETVQHFIMEVEGSSEGKTLTRAFQLIQKIGSSGSDVGDYPPKMLLVLTRGFGMNIQNAIGALRHFKCQPEPKSLLDVLEAPTPSPSSSSEGSTATAADAVIGTDQLMEQHRQVSGAQGVGESSSSYFEQGQQGNNAGYLLVTGEDSVRGLHLDGLDWVIVLGRPNGPDEYTHIAGRTGRAGKNGKVVTIVSHENAMALKSWETMLHVDFDQIGKEV